MYGQATADGHHSNPTGWKRWAHSIVIVLELVQQLYSLWQINACLSWYQQSPGYEDYDEEHIVYWWRWNLLLHTGYLVVLPAVVCVAYAPYPVYALYQVWYRT